MLAGIGVSAMLLVVSLTAPASGESLWSRGDRVSLVDLDGAPHTLNEVVGDSVPEAGVVILYWSMFQPESRRALRAFDILAAEGRERDFPARFLALALPEYRELPEQVDEFLNRAQVKLPVFIDPGGRAMEAILKALGTSGPITPMCLHISADGKLAHRYDGWTDRTVERIRSDLADARRKGGTP